MLQLRKNDEIELKIEDIGTNGEGIGRVDGAVIFVRDAVPGDRILAGITKVKKTYAYARLIRILEPSKDRVEPVCPHAGPCGGCQLQALSYEKQLEFKMRKVRDVLERIGGFSVLLPDEEDEGNADSIRMDRIVGMEHPYQYRNKAQFPIGTSADGRIITGFYAGRSHRIIENRDCALGLPVNKEILDIVISHMETHGIRAYDEAAGEGLVRHVLIRAGFVTKEIMVCMVINGIAIPHQEELADRLFAISGMTSFSVNINQKNTNVILGDEVRTIRGRDYITEKLYCGASGENEIVYRISAKSFFQVNPVQTERLYETALEFAGLTGRETVWDLYCGAGTISLFLAQQAKHVYGVEIVPEAIADAKENAKMNGIGNVTFFAGKAEEVVLREQPDVVVVDPPRKGCDEVLLLTILKMAPERIVYVSCDPATLARDLKILCADQYELIRVRPVDNFCQTSHVETVVLLSHKDPDSHIHVKVEFGEGKGKVPLDKIAERAEQYKPKEKVTYKKIKEYIEDKFGFKVHTAYIAEVKRAYGLPMYDAPNAVEELKQPRKHPTEEKVKAITDALVHFGLVDEKRASTSKIAHLSAV